MTRKLEASDGISVGVANKVTDSGSSTGPGAAGVEGFAMIAVVAAVEGAVAGP